MKKTLTIFQFIFCLSATGQVVDTCGTVASTDEQMVQKSWYYDNSYLNIIEAAKEQLLNNPFQRQANVCVNSLINPISIPIRFWIYEDAANNTLLPNDRQLQVTVDELNLLYQSNGMNVRFYMICPQFIDNPNALTMSPFESFLLNITNNDPFAIDIHIVDDYEGAGGVYNSIGDFIVIEQDIYQNVNRVSTLAHEIGHYFSLDHTHRNSDKKKCRQEAINRNTTFTFGQFFSCFGKAGRVCEKNGDALCDTPADPDFSTDVLGGKIVGCTYRPDEVEMDRWNNTYTNNNVDTRNIMSYSSRICRNNFSNGQINQMWHSILFSGFRNYIYYLNVVDNFVDPDQYEPDDSDLIGVPRLIEVGETQCHSFHGFGNCADEVDWLRIDNNEIGTFTVEIASVEGFENAVAEINIYNTDADGNRAAKYSGITGNEGSLQIPCGASTNDYLIEVIKAEDPDDEIVQSIYTVTLSATPEVTVSNFDKSEICNFDQFEVLNLPAGAIVNWLTDSSITLQVNNDQSATVTNLTQDAFAYSIIVNINFNGCQKRIVKTFTSANDGNFQSFEIIEVVRPCFPARSRFDFGVYTTSPPTNVNWSVTSGSISGNIGTRVTVLPSASSFTLTASSGVNDCGNENAVSTSFGTNECNGVFGLRVSNINEETIKIEIVDESTNFSSHSIHQVVVTDVNYVIKEQMETDENICIINTANYDDGIYIVHAYVDEHYAVEKVFVNKVDNCSSNCPCYANIIEAQLTDKTFKVEQKIISNSFNNADVTYIASESILLETGFETHRYFDFEAKIEDCQQ